MFVERPGPTRPSLGEWSDLLTPFLVVAAIAFIFVAVWQQRDRAELRYSDVWPIGLALFFAVLYTAGQAMHLPANSLSHFLTAENGGSLYGLNHLYDEVISHWQWHLGAWGLSAAAGLYQLKYSARSVYYPLALLPAALLHAFTFTFASIEGETIVFLLPLTVVAFVGYLLVAWKHRLTLLHRPATLYCLLVYGLMLLGWLGYGLAFGGFPEPTSLLGG